MEQREGKGRYYRIGEVAERTGLSQRTLRFYEERGLLKPPARMEGGFRLYTDEDIQRLEYIQRLQQNLGFTLAEIKEMVEAEEVRLELRVRFRDLAPEQRRKKLLKAIAVTEAQLELITKKAQQLEAMRQEWETRLQHYRNHLAQMSSEEEGAEAQSSARPSS